MARDHERASLARWGDTAWRLALLATNRRSTAEAITVAACSHVLAAPDADFPTALFVELTRQQQRTRWRDGRRNRTLPRTLRHMAPRARLLLGLWLLHDIDGQRLAQLVERPIPTIIAQVSNAVFRAAATLDRSVARPCLDVWIAAQLGVTIGNDPHRCTDCARSEPIWNAAFATLRADVHATVEHAHLPQPLHNMIETRLRHHEQPPIAWRQQRRVVLSALIGGIAAALALLIVPNGGASSAGPAPSAAQIRDFVQQASDRWSDVPTAVVRHWQVRAVLSDILPQEPTITDVWLGPGDEGRHRVEVRRGDTVIEAQSADGLSELKYRAAAGASSCPWSAALDETQPAQNVVLQLGPNDQRAARDAILRQGAYGAGYQALAQALAARDLRTFGLRNDGSRRLVVAAYTTADNQQRLLLINPVDSQLVAVQALSVVSGQVQIRDLWRLLARDERAPPGYVSGAEEEYRRFDRLVDPACPALRAATMRSLSTLTDNVRAPWYLPPTLPPGITRAAIFASDVPGPSDDGSDEPQYYAVFRGSERRLRLSAAVWRPNPGAVGDEQRGPWRIAVRQTTDGAWQGVLRRALEITQPAFVPTVELTASGFSEAELRSVIDSLVAVDANVWRNLHANMLDPQPLPPATAQLFVQAISALPPPADRTLFTQTRITTRTGPQPQLADPYYVPNAARFPPMLTRRQWLVAADTTISRFRDVYTLPDGTLHHARVNDGTRMVYDQRADGWQGSEVAGPVAAEVVPQQPGLEMVTALLSQSEPIEQQADGDNWVLTQTIPARETGNNTRRRALRLSSIVDDLPRPWLDDLPAGDFVQRLWIDQTTFMPQRFALSWRTIDGQDVPLQQIDLIERRVEASPPADLGALPPLPDDVLRFNATAYRWRNARNASQFMSIHWTMSSLNFDPAARSTLESSVQPPAQTLAWPSGVGATINWQLAPATSLAQLNIGTLQTSTWHDLSSISALDRTQYTLPGGTITLTQGPRRLLRNLLRYPPDGDRWSSSEPLTVNIVGGLRPAWLLYDDRLGVAVLVIEVDDVLLHINGPLNYVRGALLNDLTTLQWTARGEPR